MAKNFELIPFPAPDELARAVAEAWLIDVAAAAGKPYCVALSGGRITLKFFAEVVVLSKARDVSLAHVHFFWADERCVPPTDAESNFKPANELFFQPLGIAPEKIHRIRGELSPAQAVELATEDILSDKSALYANASPLTVTDHESLQPALDLILLGMGEDGHVASLFPTEPEDARRDPAVFRAIANSPKPPPNRVTLGYAAIAAAKNVWVLASGKGKEAAFAESISPTGKTPLARVLKSRPSSKIFTDISL